MSSKSRLRIGCPVWACPHWRGSVYPSKSPRPNWLKEYSKVFSTVEGNSTFYAIPALDTFKRWAAETVEDFRFVLKFPRVISHEKKLVGAELETDLFLGGLDILHDAGKLGPSFLQLAPTFNPQQGMSLLRKYLEQLPGQFPYAVEVRHQDFFRPPFEDQLNSMLRAFGVDRVIFDSRPLFSQPAADEIEAVSQQRKPKSPIIKTVTGTRPILRLVGRNDLNLVHPWVEEWSRECASWLSDGLEPYVFTHAPDDRFAPEFAQLFAKASNTTGSVATKIQFKTQPKKVQGSLF